MPFTAPPPIITATLPPFEGTEALLLGLGLDSEFSSVIQPFVTGVGQTYRVSLAVIGWDGATGTDWEDPNSLLEVTSITRIDAGHMVLQFSCVTNRTYLIEYTTNLNNNGDWTTVTDPSFTFPSPGVCEWIDDGTQTGGMNQSFRAYRVEVDLTVTPP